MTQRKNYSRYFIILQEDEKGYGLAPDKSPNGYVKLEMKNGKCKISYYVQNLKKGSEPYHMILVCDKKNSNKLIKLGTLDIDQYGRIEVAMEHPMENIASSGLAMDKIGGAAVAIISDGKVSSIMSGFITRDIPENWKEYSLIEARVEETKEEIKEETKEETQRAEVKKEEVEKVEEESEHTNEVRNEEEKITESSTIFEQYEKKIEEVKNAEERSSEDYPKGRTGEFFKQLVQGFEEEKGIGEEFKRCKWYKIPINSMENDSNIKDYNKYTIIYYPMLTYYPYLNKQDHYLIGFKCDKDENMKYLIYGIPGTKNKKDQPFGGQTGFVTWIPKDGDTGYWLMFYDFKNATILIPFRD